MLRRVRHEHEMGQLAGGERAAFVAVFAEDVAVHEPERLLPEQWQRVVHADGSIPKGKRQRDLLVKEGVVMKGDRVDMKRSRAW
jgi:alkylated DNA nucleotide flippase Atl1